MFISRFAATTNKKLKWAVSLFNKWKLARAKASFSHKSITPIVGELEHMSNEQLNYALSRFIQEIKKQNGNPYPGKTLKECVLAIQMYLASLDKPYKFLEDIAFKELKNTLDNVMKSKAKQGIGAYIKQAKEITIDEENIMWEMGILGESDPETLFNTVFYLVGLHFALRGGQEHRDLRAGENSQLNIQVDVNGTRYLEYNEETSKCMTGGLKDIDIKRKCVKAFENKSEPNKCIVRLYEKYMSLCPSPRPCPFYLRPLKGKHANVGKVWFSNLPVGHNTLSKVVSNVCSKAQLPGFRSNHSLRRTCATRLYDCGMDEQIIQEITGHRSLSVRKYKRTSDAARQTVSSNLYNPSTSSNKNTMQTGNENNASSPKKMCFNININFAK